MEIIMMLKGLLMATFCPSLALYLMARGKVDVYCGVGNYGHTIETLWNVHKYHHQFFNPTPFAVIADEYLDQLVRASPLLFLPTMMPINMNLLFFRAERFNSKQSTT
ncbi:unnamed protein product [Rotaria socialis]|uniref:Uncharacterized protein n=1 Tax=Rotaria socialis TaxID=392032 RepID=A0A820L416_9BILA|nr:unnamed protein product [Rotaria socialis]CAF4547574.1 unnamed protein product [Rotaria socialis]